MLCDITLIYGWMLKTMSATAYIRLLNFFFLDYLNFLYLDLLLQMLYMQSDVFDRI